jgi:hypothetical protein
MQSVLYTYERDFSDSRKMSFVVKEMFSKNYAVVSTSFYLCAQMSYEIYVHPITH